MKSVIRNYLYPILCCLVTSILATAGFAQEEADKQSEVIVKRPGYLVQIPLPLTLKSVPQVEQTLERLLEKAPLVDDPKSRAVIVLQFDTTRGSTGSGSDFYACAKLAKVLTSTAFNRVKTVGFVPESRVRNAEDDDLPATRLVGHAVLVALACDDVVLFEKAAIGQASIDETQIEPDVRITYETIANKRRTLPIPFAMSMLDPAASLHEVDTLAGTLYVDDARLAELETQEGAPSVELSKAGSLPLYSAAQVAKASISVNTISNRSDFAERYGIPVDVLEGDPSGGKEFNAIQIELPSVIDGRTVEWSLRSLDAELARDTNFIVINLDCDGGDLLNCIQFARYLSGLDSDQVRTVAYVNGHVRGPPAIIALACDHLVMSPKARLGGVYEPTLTEQELSDVRELLKEIAAEKERPWSLFEAMLDRKLELKKYQRKTTTRLFSKAEFEGLDEKAQQDWKVVDVVDMQQGLSGESVVNLYIAKTLVDNPDQFQAYYHLEGSPRVLKPTRTDKAIEGFARFLASPVVSMWLLFGAMFFISTEMSNPGLSVPGFLGTVCLILFFWSQYLDGNAHWLEIMMFIAGVIFIILELFVLPGVGIFGIGGVLMVICSIVLASQTFIIPRTQEELARMPVSLGMLVAAGGGFLVAIAVLRKVIPNTPYFKKMMLEPPEQDGPGVADSEAIVDYSDLMGQSGTAVTKLMPTGKARIGGKVVNVITDGRVVEKGEALVVIEALGNRVVVAPKSGEPQ